MQKNLEILKKHPIANFVMSCAFGILACLSYVGVISDPETKDAITEIRQQWHEERVADNAKIMKAMNIIISDTDQPLDLTTLLEQNKNISLKCDAYAMAMWDVLQQGTYLTQEELEEFTYRVEQAYTQEVTRRKIDEVPSETRVLKNKQLLAEAVQTEKELVDLFNMIGHGSGAIAIAKGQNKGWADDDAVHARNELARVLKAGRYQILNAIETYLPEEMTDFDRETKQLLEQEKTEWERKQEGEQAPLPYKEQ